jgi:magnesium and cobalt transporter
MCAHSKTAVSNDISDAPQGLGMTSADSSGDDHPPSRVISALPEPVKISPEPVRDLTQEPSATGLWGWVKSILPGRSDTNLREALEEYIENQEEDKGESDASVSSHEKLLISNVLELRDTTVQDIMIPRADIVGIELDSTQEEIFALLAEKQYSRLPVYQGTLDEILGTIHIKDILSCLAQGQPLVVRDLIRDVPIVSPSLHILDLLLQMRETRKHMALVVDEFGGIDGLVTIGDVLESIIGQIEDEHDPDQSLEMTLRPDGSVIADARVYLDEFEERFGLTLHEDDKEDNDTLGGLVFTIAGRVPARGEILTHDNGMVFEVLEADPRRVGRLKITNIPGLVAP